MSSVGSRLKAERKRLGYTKQGDFGATINVSFTTISRWELNTTPVPSNKLLEMKSLGVDIAYILGIDKPTDEPTPVPPKPANTTYGFAKQIAVLVKSNKAITTFGQAQAMDAAMLLVLGPLVFDAYQGFKKRASSGEMPAEFYMNILNKDKNK